MKRHWMGWTVSQQRLALNKAIATVCERHTMESLEDYPHLCNSALVEVVFEDKGNFFMAEVFVTVPDDTPDEEEESRRVYQHFNYWLERLLEVVDILISDERPDATALRTELLKLMGVSTPETPAAPSAGGVSCPPGWDHV